MPEYAPVMSITFPATSSLNMDLLMERRSLKNRYAGRDYDIHDFVNDIHGFSAEESEREREREREF